MEKVQLCPQQGQDKSQCQSFYSLLSLVLWSPQVATKWSQSPSRQLSLFPAALVAKFMWLLRPHGCGERTWEWVEWMHYWVEKRERLVLLEPTPADAGPGGARPKGSCISRWESRNEQRSASLVGWVRERERERERESERARVHFFVPLGLKPGAWVWDDQVLFEKNQSTSQTFTSFIWVYPLVRLTGLYGPAPSPVPPTFQYWKGEGGSVNPFGRAMLCFPGVWSCSFLVKQTGFCSPVCSAQCLVPFAPRF